MLTNVDATIVKVVMEPLVSSAGRGTTASTRYSIIPMQRVIDGLDVSVVQKHGSLSLSLGLKPKKDT